MFLLCNTWRNMRLTISFFCSGIIEEHLKKGKFIIEELEDTFPKVCLNALHKALYRGADAWQRADCHTDSDKILLLHHVEMCFPCFSLFVTSIGCFAVGNSRRNELIVNLNTFPQSNIT